MFAFHEIDTGALSFYSIGQSEFCHHAVLKEVSKFFQFRSPNILDLLASIIISMGNYGSPIYLEGTKQESFA